MKGLRGYATGIGSLPFTDPRRAVDEVFSHVAQIPFWPQLPRRGACEGMVAQFIEGLPCLHMRGNDVVYSPDDQEAALERFYGHVIAQDTEPFAITGECSLGLQHFYRRIDEDPACLGRAECIKCHITGPFTFGASVKDARGVALMHDEIMMQAIVAGLTMKALWQIRLFEKFGKRIIVFIDEPFLAGFGSAYTALNRHTVVRTLGELTAPLRAAGALTGVHCCGNTDWSMFADVDSIDIINFDAYSFLDKVILYAPQMKSFLMRGGALCWGIVPTQDYTGSQTAQGLVQRISEGIDALVRKGIDRQSLRDQILISPSCGLGALDESAASKILALLEETAALLRAFP